MNCKRVRELLPHYADDDRAHFTSHEWESVSRHLEGCEECRRRLDVDRRLASAFVNAAAELREATDPGPWPRPSLRQRVMAEIARYERRQPFWRTLEAVGNATVAVVGPALIGILMAALIILGRPIVEQRTGIGSLPTAPSPASAMPTALPSATTGDVPPCRAADLSAVAYWGDAGGSLTGSITFTNEGTTPCAVQGRPEVKLLDANSQILPIDVVAAPGRTGQPDAPFVVLQPEDQTESLLSWSNWCGLKPEGGIFLASTLPDGHVQIFARNRSGNPLEGVPRCDAPEQPSRLSIGAFEAKLTTTPAGAIGAVGLRLDQLGDVVEITVMDDRKVAIKTVDDAAVIQPIARALGNARLVGVKQPDATSSGPSYLLQIKARDGSVFTLTYLPKGQGGNVEDPGPRELWNAPELDAAMQSIVADLSQTLAAWQHGAWRIVRDEAIAPRYGWALVGQRVDRWPQFSPDGSTIVYVPADGKGSPNTRLIVRDVATGAERDLTPEQGFEYSSVRWSPDGRSLAFVKHRREPGKATSSELWRIDADGRNAKMLYRREPCNAKADGPALGINRWTPDGQAIEFGGTIFDCLTGTLMRARSDGSGVETVTGPAHLLTATDCGLREDDQRWHGTFASPTGDYVLCLVDTAALTAKPAGAPDSGDSLVRYDVKARQVAIMASWPPGVELSVSSISPDGEWIALSAIKRSPNSPASEPAHIWVVRRDGTGLREVAGAPYQFGQDTWRLRWSTVGRAYFLALPTNATNQVEGFLYELDAATGAARIVTLDWRAHGIAAVSPDGRHVLIFRGDPLDAELHLLELAQSGTNQPIASAKPSPTSNGPAATWASLGQVRPLWAERSATPRSPVLVADSVDPRRIAYCASGGVRVSPDDGSTWSTVSTVPIAPVAAATDYPLVPSEPAGIVCTALALDPQHPQSYYVAMPSVRKPDNALPPTYQIAYYTADGGKSWQPVPAPAESTADQFGGFQVDGLVVKAIFRVPDASDAAPTFVVQQTIDGGRTWSSGQLNCPTSVPCVRWGPTPSQLGNMAVVHLQPLVRSTDGGQLWEEVGQPQGAHVLAPEAAQLAALGPTAVALLTGSGPQPFLLSRDGGQTWQTVALPPLPGANDGPYPFPGLQMLPNGSLLAQAPDSGRWHLLAAGADEWCAIGGDPPPSTLDVLGTVQAIGDRLWWLQPAAGPESVSVGELRCGLVASSSITP